jgi:pimeloyl-ACP methyl ester carboxylesterase
MPIAVVGGIRIHFDEYGSGEPVLLIMGAGARGGLWRTYQVPALTAAGYRAIIFDNRGVPPTDAGTAGFTLDDMVADTAGLIERLGIGPCCVVGFSLGGIILQELMLARPELVTRAVVMATRGRSDTLRVAMTEAEAELRECGITLPPKYAACVRATQYLSPRTQENERLIRDWLEVFKVSSKDTSLSYAQQGLEMIGNRLEEYRKITSPCLVIGFQDDVVAPPFFGREIAEHIPACDYAEVAGCGHYCYLEQPAEVNSLIIDFFRASGHYMRKRSLHALRINQRYPSVIRARGNRQAGADDHGPGGRRKCLADESGTRADQGRV